MMMNNNSDSLVHSVVVNGVNWRGILLYTVMIFFTILTILGNTLVVFAVTKKRYLRTITNYFIVSLAIADLLMGAVVMPFAVVQEIMMGDWPFGQVWCDLWHAFDVLCSTASILNLCMIALERYWATENPVTYSTRMSKSRCLAMVWVVWVCSSAISFPAIVWWRLVPNNPIEKHNNSSIVSSDEWVCLFTDDFIYLILSSTISFYIPLLVMLFVYYRIYCTAANLIKSLNAGTKVIYKNSQNGEVVTLRIHRGGTMKRPRTNDSETTSSMKSHLSTPKSSNKSSKKHVSSWEPTSPDFLLSPTPTKQCGIYNPMISDTENEDTTDSEGTNNNISKRIRLFAVGKRLTKFAREQKAAKTLGIVMGIFIICWLPFFICNTIVAINKNVMGENIGNIMTFVTWLGYINSSVNPLIYAHSMRDFRRAFITILCPNCVSSRGGGGSYLKYQSRSASIRLTNNHSRRCQHATIREHTSSPCHSPGGLAIRTSNNSDFDSLNSPLPNSSQRIHLAVL